ncbi:DUF6779 domain-containing protein [Nocardia sp. NPDC050710]|uniref:DUF6779 domain-containing protein n=1 Tax=Nocardia sp. NPDC050710 TaxID=3157220 RepID=UPI0033D06F8C
MVASVFLVFSNSLQFTRIGLVAALWAAAIGALAATKFRKEASVDQAKVRDLQTVYELQLEREVTARREYELGVEARVREEVGADAAEMAALRAELSVLRQSLQRLFDGELPMDRPALRADATRIHELESSSADPANSSSVNADGWGPHLPQQPRSSVTPVFVADHPEPPLFASPFDEPVTAETSVVPRDGDYDDGGDYDGDDYDNGGYNIGGYNIGGYNTDGYDDGDYDGDGYRDAETTDVDIDVNGYAQPQQAPVGWADAFTETEEPPAVPQRLPAPDAAPESPSRPAGTTPTAAPTVGTAGRRRRAETNGDSGNASRRLSVAEIMANLQSEENGNGHR